MCACVETVFLYYNELRKCQISFMKSDTTWLRIIEQYRGVDFVKGSRKGIAMMIYLIQIVRLSDINSSCD